MLLIDDFAKLELQVLLLSSVTQSSGNEEASGVSASGLEVEDLMGITALVNITENSIEDVLEEAANYTINISDEVNKKFTNGNKKYRLMKVVRAKPFGREKKSESVETNVLRNIKLEVDGKGNKKVPNLFKIRRKARYPNYVRKHRQIYRGDFPDYPGKKLDHQPGLKNKIVAVAENSASESKIAPTFAHIGPVAPLQGGHLHGVTPVPASGPSSFAPTRAPFPPSPTRAPPRYPSSTAGRSYHYTTRSSFVSVQFGRAPVQTVTAVSRAPVQTFTAPSSPVYPVSGHSSTLPPLLPSYVSPSPTPSKAPLVLSSPAPSLSPLVLSPLPPSKAPSVVSSPAPSVAPLILSSPFPVASSTPHINSLPPTFGPHLSASAAAPKIYKSSISLKKTTTSSTTTTSIPKTTTSTFTTTTGKVTSSTPSSVLPPQTVSLGLPLVPEPVQPVRVQLQPSAVHLPGPPVPIQPQPRPHLPVSPGPSPLPAAPGHIAVGSRAHIDNLFRDYERTGTILSLYDEDRNIKLLGPIAVRATGPSTFQVIDTNRFERHQPLVVIPNNIQTHPATTKKTTKRPSLHFEPIKEKTRKEKVLPAKINLSSKNLGAGWNVLEEPLGDQYRSRRWPSKPTPRSNVNRRHRSLKVRFEDLSNGSSEVAPKKHFRFPS